MLVCFPNNLSYIDVMTNEERETLYNKLMRILMLMEEMDNNTAAMELEYLIEQIKFGRVN